MHGERNVHRVLQGKPDGKKPLGRLRHGWEDTKMDLKDVPNTLQTVLPWIK
jgi:hypothetical protein